MNLKLKNRIYQDFDDAYQFPIDYYVTNRQKVQGHITLWKEDIESTESYISKQTKKISDSKCIINHVKFGKMVINQNQNEVDNIVFKGNYKKNLIGFKI